jgi:hypothetical protein
LRAGAADHRARHRPPPSTLGCNLAPLDQVSARRRAKVLFGFDYIWEVYKPEHLRKYGYYVLPVLWGDRLVALFDSKLDGTMNTFIILSLWLEDEALGRDEAFALALA